MPIRTQPKPCVICGLEIPKNRLRYITCSEPCAKKRRETGWKDQNNCKANDTEGPDVARVSKWLVKSWRVAA